MNIVVLAGGYSPERDVSLSSGSKIAHALASKGHAVVMADLFLGIEAPQGGLSALFKRGADFQPQISPIPSTPPDLKKLWKARVPDTGTQFGQNILPLCQLANVVFLALHGDAGENGKLQAVFDLLNIAYTGSPFTGCVLAMDKNLTKELLKVNGLPTAPWVHLPNAASPDYDAIEALGYPVVVKPTRGGSSIGVSIAHDRQALERAIEIGAAVEPDLVIEKYFGGREMCVGILNGKPLTPIEIIPISGFFDYEKKYQDGLTQEICPADIAAEEKAALQDAALKIHRILQLGFYSRIDFKMEDKDNFICLEANTLPGMTPASIFPKEAAEAGIAYADLCEMIVKGAIS